MSIEQRIAGLFGRVVVYLRDHDGEITKRWAKRTPFGLTCARMSFGVAPCLLIEGGKVLGPGFVHEWRTTGNDGAGHGGVE